MQQGSWFMCLREFEDAPLNDYCGSHHIDV